MPSGKDLAELKSLLYRPMPPSGMPNIADDHCIARDAVENQIPIRPRNFHENSWGVGASTNSWKGGETSYSRLDHPGYGCGCTRALAVNARKDCLQFCVSGRSVAYFHAP